MIKIDRKKSIVPLKLSGDGKKARAVNEKMYDNGQEDFEFKNTIYGHEKVKAILKDTQYNKCAYCEAKVTVVAYGDVEHFRPKGGWKQTKNQKLQKPGYYWLAYEWDNLLFSCQICNQRANKGNLFPLKNPADRALSHRDSIEKEENLLLNPLTQDPEKHIEFKQHIIRSLSVEGTTTINVCGLDRADLNEDRKDLFSIIETLIDLITLFENSSDPSVLSSIKKNVDEARNQLNRRILSSSPYSSMVKCAVKESGITLH